MPPKSVASVVRPLVWLRNDLRLSDNVALASSLKHGSPILLFCFDLRQFVQIDYGFRKTGAWRARFLLECVTDLKRSCQALNSDLVVRVGKPEQHIEEIIARYGITQVFAQKETTSEEIDVETKVARACQSHNATLNLVWGSTLFHIDDIPFRPRDVPDIFTTFRKRVENESQIRNLFPRPEKLDSLPEGLDAGNVPRLEDLGFDVKETGRVQRQPGRQVGFSLLGGESHAMARMTDFIWTKNLLREYKDIRNGMLGMDYSTKLSPYLAHGCISARQIYFEVLKYEEQREKNDSTYWLLFELVWRDYFRFVSIKYGTRLFFRDGMIGAGKKKTWKANPLMFEAWKNGRTGYPLVDANMREMLATGFMSNRGRQNVASFFSKDMQLDWRIGAAWFENCLIDYDPCSNWGNWQYVSGVGNDPREDRHFNVTRQAMMYDAQGDYLRHWLPELASLPTEKLFEPWKLSTQDQDKYRVYIGRDYPAPIVSPDHFRTPTSRPTSGPGRATRGGKVVHGYTPK